MKYYIVHHQHKGFKIHEIIKKAGWKIDHKNPDILLIDHDIGKWNSGEHRKIVELYKEKGTTIIIYPHSATIPWWYDGIVAPDEGVKAILVGTEFQREITSTFVKVTPVYSIGWAFCPQKKFQKIDQISKILFAPIHPPMNGFLRSEAKESNTRILRKLIELTPKVQVVVRHIGNLERQGLFNHAKIIYKNGKPDGNYQDIDWADLVIAEGTFMYMAVSRGKPVVGINQNIPITPNNQNGEIVPKTWSNYGNKMAYPIDFNEQNMLELFCRATSEEQSEWRKNFVGEDIEPTKFIALLNNIRRKDAR